MTAGGGSKTGGGVSTGIGSIMAGSIVRLSPALRLGTGQVSPSKEISAGGRDSAYLMRSVSFSSFSYPQ